jgi:hypothetical protein
MLTSKLVLPSLFQPVCFLSCKKCEIMLPSGREHKFASKFMVINYCRGRDLNTWTLKSDYIKIEMMIFSYEINLGFYLVNLQC